MKENHKKVDPERLKNATTLLHDSFLWINDRKSNEHAKKDLEQDLRDFFFLMRKNILMQCLILNSNSSINEDLYILKNSCSVIHVSEPPKLTNTIKSSTSQEIAIHVMNLIQNPDYFAKNIRKPNFWNDKKQHNLTFFAYVTFPSIFSYFLIPEAASKALQFLKILSNIDDEISLNLCASFYICFPSFTNTLCEHFFSELINEKILSSSNGMEKSVSYTKVTIMKMFQLLIKSLELSMFCLNSYHRDLSTFLFKTKNDFFTKLVFQFILFPTLKNYTDYIFDSQIKKEVNALLKYFFSILISSLYEPTNQKMFYPTIQLILKIFYNNPTSYNELDDIGGLGSLEFKNYPSYVSVYELLILHDINNSKPETPSIASCRKEIMKTRDKLFKTTSHDIYNIISNRWSDDDISYQLLKLPRFKIKNESPEYVRWFTNIGNTEDVCKIDFFYFINKDIKTDMYTEFKRKYEMLGESKKMINQEGFQHYCYLKYYEKYQQIAGKFDRMLSTVLIKQYIQKFYESSLEYNETLIAIMSKDFLLIPKNPYTQLIYHLINPNCDSIKETQKREKLGFVILKKVDTLLDTAKCNQYLESLNEEDNPHKSDIQNIITYVRYLNLKDSTVQMIQFPQIIKKVREICDNDSMHSLVLLNSILHENNCASFYSAMLIYLKHVSKHFYACTSHKGNFIKFINGQWMFVYDTISSLDQTITNLYKY